MDHEALREQIENQVRSEIQRHVSGEAMLEESFLSKAMSVLSGLGLGGGTLAAVAGAAIIGVPLLSLGAIALVGGAATVSALGFISRKEEEDKDFKREVEKLDALIRERDELILRALKEGNPPEDLGRYKNRIVRLSEKQKRQAQRIRRIIQKNQSEFYQGMTLREKGQLEGLLRAAEKGQLTGLPER